MGVEQRLLAAATAVLATAVLVACGGDGRSGLRSTATSISAQQKKSGKPASKAEGAGKVEPNRPHGEFKPTHHEDSGGGSAQVHATEGNISIVEFGKESSRAEFRQAAATLHDFLDAAAVNDWGAACEYMANQVAEGLKRLAGSNNSEGCAAILEKLAQAPEAGKIGADAKRADVISLRIDGKRAFAIDRGHGGKPLAIGMTKEGGDWKVAGLVGQPLD